MSISDFTNEELMNYVFQSTEKINTTNLSNQRNSDVYLSDHWRQGQIKFNEQISIQAAGTAVTGVKGDNEISYRTGNVNITKSNIGLSNVDNTSDATKTVSSANTLSTTRTIGIDTGVTATATAFNGSSNISIPINSIKEPYLAFGGKNITGTISPVDMGICSNFSANRFAFLSGDYITVEYSNDGGTTWTDSGLSSASKSSIVTGANSVYIGGKTSNITTDDQLRVTITAASGVLYTSLKKLYLNISTQGASGSNVVLEGRTIGNYNNSVDTWVTLNSSPISGWSGWNVLNQTVTFGGSTSQTSQYRQIRLIFSITGLRGSYSNALSLISLYGYGENAWNTPSNMAKTDHLYTFDINQNVTFPANLSATSFIEGGTSLSSKYYLATNPNGYTSNVGTVTSVGLSVPTGLSISGSPITSSGTLAIGLASGYTIPKSTVGTLSASGQTITYTKSDGTTGTITTQDTNTTYSAGTGISLSGTTFSNSGVLSINGSAGVITNVAKKNENNNFTSQTITGNLTVEGDITQNGSSYETHAEQIYTKNDYIILRDGATGGLATGAYAGFEAVKYDGTNNGRLVFDNTGTARVGDVGDEQPLATRAESNTFINNNFIKWNSNTIRLEDSGFSYKDTVVHIEGTGTTAGTWIGASDKITSYYTGLMINYRVPVAGASTTTLNINGLGAKKVFRNGTGAVTTHYPANSSLLLVYDETLNSSAGGWQSIGDYDSTDTQMLRPYYARYYTGANPLYRYKICGIDAQGRIQPLTLEDGTSTSKTINTTGIQPDKIFWYSSTTTVNANSLIEHAVLYNAYGTSTPAYTFNSTITTYKNIYLKGIYNKETGLFTLDNSSATSWYVLTPDNTDFVLSDYFDINHQYIYLGTSYSSNNNMYLFPVHTMYNYNGSALIEYETPDQHLTQLTWNNGTVEGPTLNATILDADSVVSPAIPSASEVNSGIINTTSQTFLGSKTFKSSDYPVLTVRREQNSSTGAYASTKHYRPCNLSGAYVGEYFCTNDSAGNETQGGFIAGGLLTSNNGSEVGQLILAPGYHGVDPYNRTDFTITAKTADTSSFNMKGVLNVTETISENGVLLSNKYAAKIHRHDYSDIDNHPADKYAQSFNWTNGNTNGPTGSLAIANGDAVAFASIPSASIDKSGVVTTGNQVFSGIKTLNAGQLILQNRGTNNEKVSIISSSDNSLTNLSFTLPTKTGTLALTTDIDDKIAGEIGNAMIRLVITGGSNPHTFSFTTNQTVNPENPEEPFVCDIAIPSKYDEINHPDGYCTIENIPTSLPQRIYWRSAILPQSPQSSDEASDDPTKGWSIYNQDTDWQSQLVKSSSEDFVSFTQANYNLNLLKKGSLNICLNNNSNINLDFIEMEESTDITYAVLGKATVGNISSEDNLVYYDTSCYLYKNMTFMPTLDYSYINIEDLITKYNIKSQGDIDTDTVISTIDRDYAFYFLRKVSTSQTYIYTTDEAFATAASSAEGVQVGCAVLKLLKYYKTVQSFLEDSKILNSLSLGEQIYIEETKSYFVIRNTSSSLNSYIFSTNSQFQNDLLAETQIGYYIPSLTIGSQGKYEKDYNTWMLEGSAGYLKEKYSTILELVSALNVANNTAYAVEESFYVDKAYHIYQVNDTSTTYNYTSDADFETAMNSGGIDIGYYHLSNGMQIGHSWNYSASTVSNFISFYNSRSDTNRINDTACVSNPGYGFYISGKSTTTQSYTYTTDEDFIIAASSTNGVQVGYCIWKIIKYYATIEEYLVAADSLSSFNVNDRVYIDELEAYFYIGVKQSTTNSYNYTSKYQFSKDLASNSQIGCYISSHVICETPIYNVAINSLQFENDKFLYHIITDPYLVETSLVTISCPTIISKAITISLSKYKGHSVLKAVMPSFSDYMNFDFVNGPNYTQIPISYSIEYLLNQEKRGQVNINWETSAGIRNEKGGEIFNNYIGLTDVGIAGKNNAYGLLSHAEGNGTTAIGIASHAENSGVAIGLGSHAEGTNRYTTVRSSVTNSVILPLNTQSWSSNWTKIYVNEQFRNVVSETSTTSFPYNVILTLDEPITCNKGECVFFEGSIGKHSHTEGSDNLAAGDSSHAEGADNTINSNGRCAHAEGEHNTVNGNNSHAEGEHNTVNGNNSHAEGEHNTVNGNNSHVEGNNNTVNGNNSHASGQYLTVNGNNQTVLGIANDVTNASNLTDLLIVGNGTYGDSSNALILTNDGILNIFNSGYKLVSPTLTKDAVIATLDDVQVAGGTVPIAFDNSTNWSASINSDGNYVLTLTSSKYPVQCFNSNNKSVVVTMSFTGTTVTVESPSKFAGTLIVV